jgi:hypothetical protein
VLSLQCLCPVSTCLFRWPAILLQYLTFKVTYFDSVGTEFRFRFNTLLLYVNRTIEFLLIYKYKNDS